MPKIITGLKDKILGCAKKLLFEQGLDALTIRAVARQCGVAVGTVYHYYDSKDALIAGIMLEDWHKTLRQIEQQMDEVQNISDGLRAICLGICEFAGQYRGVWAQDTHPFKGEYHERLIDQIGGQIQTLMERFSQNWEEAVPSFIAENLLRLAMKGMDAYEKEAFLLLRVIGI